MGFPNFSNSTVLLTSNHKEVPLNSFPLKEKIATFLQTLKRKKALKKEIEETQRDALPPFLASQVILNDRIRVFKSLCGVFAIGFVISTALLLTERERKEIIVVPGIPDVMKRRAGTIPDELVFAFAEHAARLLGTFSYRSVARQYKDLSELMAPEFKHRFLYSAEKQFSIFQELRVDEIFDFDPVTKFEIKSESKGPRYHVEVRGHTKKYIEGNLRDTVSEVFVFELTTTPMRPDKPYLLEITNFRRSTPEEEANIEKAASFDFQ